MEDDKFEFANLVETAKSQFKKLSKKQRGMLLISIMIILLVININPLSLLGVLYLINLVFRGDHGLFK